MFKDLDLDRDQMLDIHEVTAALEKLGVHSSDEELAVLFGLLRGKPGQRTVETAALQEAAGGTAAAAREGEAAHSTAAAEATAGEGAGGEGGGGRGERTPRLQQRRPRLKPISYTQFKQFVEGREKELLEVFQEIDRNGNGVLEPSEVDAALRKLGYESSAERVVHMIAQLDSNEDGLVDFLEFKRLTLLMPSARVEDVFSVWGSFADTLDLGETSATPLHADVFLSWEGKVLVAGGVAGAVSRTATAPFDRLKVLLQAGARIDGRPVAGIVDGMRAIYREGGLAAFFRGNGTNIVKIMPESAVKFFAFEWLRKAIVKDPANVTVPERFVAGALAGVTAQTAIYPLEVAKTRLGVAPSNTYRGLVHCLSVTARDGGARALYRGLAPSLTGIVPYAGVDLCIYFTLKDMWLKRHPNQDPGVLLTLAIGAGSSFCGQTISYPLQLVRTRLQAQGTVGMPVQYSGMVDCFQQLVRRDGYASLYRGITPNFMKAIPAISLSYVVYEKMKILLGMGQRR